MWKLALPAIMLAIGSVMAGPAQALCGAFVCNREYCQYSVVSSTGPRMARVYLGHREILSGLGPDAAYCDWANGRCVTPRRPVLSLGPC